MKPARVPRRAFGVIAGVAGIALTVAYPLFVFYGLRRHSPSAVAGFLLVVLVPLAALRWAKMRPKTDRPGGAHLRRVGGLPLVVVGLVAASAFLGHAGLMLVVPVVVNGVLGVTFGSTLWSDQPMIERFARLQHADLNARERAWCRMWTWIWTGFFALNVVLIASLVLAGLLAWWTYYTGLWAYVLMGVLFASEYVLRKARFGRLTGHPWDRALASLFARLGWLPDASADASAAGRSAP